MVSLPRYLFYLYLYVQLRRDYEVQISKIAGDWRVARAVRTRQNWSANAEQYVLDFNSNLLSQQRSANFGITNRTAFTQETREFFSKKNRVPARSNNCVFDENNNMNK